MPSVRVPAEFFRAELRMYGDWREAFARELLQNAFDAGSTRVEVDVSFAAGNVRVVVSDDGHGMDRRVLEDVFFALGATTKTGADTIGGFGRARIITCFAQESYTIETGRLVVSGTGGSYDIAEVDTVRPGCRFDITTVETDPVRIRRAFERVLSVATPNSFVTVDGDAARTYDRPERAVRVLRDDDGAPWAKVYVRRNSYGQLLVRTGGMTMFSRYLPGFDDVVVELPVKRSRELLSASRDRLVAGYDGLLDRFVADVTTNHASALRERAAAPLSVHVRGAGFLFSAAPNLLPDQSATRPSTRPSSSTSEAASEEQASSAPLPDDRVAVSLAPGSAAAQHVLLAQQDHTRLEPAVRRDATVSPAADSWSGFDVFLTAEVDDARTRRLLRRYDVRRWSGPSRKSKLLAAWRAALTVAVDALLVRVPSIDGVAWTVGWVFDPAVEASHRAHGVGHVFSLNPVPSSRRSQLGFSTPADRRHLIALAAHEVCHVVVDSHNESFASLLTDLYAQIDPSLAHRAIRRAIS